VLVLTLAKLGGTPENIEQALGCHHGSPHPVPAGMGQAHQT